MFVGARHGYLVAGLLGGIVSSTSVTLSFARASRTEDPAFGRPLAFGVIGACTVLFVRVMAAIAVLYAPLAVALVPLLAAPFLVGIIAILLGLTAGAGVASRPQRAGEPAAVRRRAADGAAVPGRAVRGRRRPSGLGRRGAGRVGRHPRPGRRGRAR